MTLRALRRTVVQAFVLSTTVATSGAQSQTAPPSEPPAANPGRPTLTSPATLAPIGYLQFEQGYLGSLTSPETASQYGVNQVTKLTVQRRLLLQVLSQPFAQSRAVENSDSTRDAGDLLLGAQIVLYTPDTSQVKISAEEGHSTAPRKSLLPTVSLGYIGRVHAGTAPDIDLGAFSKSLILLLSGDLGGFHYDSNYQFNQQNGPSEDGSHDVRRAQCGQTLAVNHALFGPKLQLAVELYHLSQPLLYVEHDGRPAGRANLVDVLVSPSYVLEPNLVLDAGFARGLTATSTKWQSFVGFTYLLPHRLWKTRE